MNTIYALLLIIIALQVVGLIIITKPYWEREEETDGAGLEDTELYEQALETVQKLGKASTSLLQRKLCIGYARAAYLMDMLEENKIISPAVGANPRKVFENK